jgi:hypothetical protein
MTCCNSITRPQFIPIDPTTNPQRIIVDTSMGQVEAMINITEYGFFYLTLHIQTNFLVYDPYRFIVFNRTEQHFEPSLGEGFLLSNDFHYEIYDRDEMILSLNPSTIITTS